MAFKKVNPKQSFPELEEEILKFWDEEKIFEESIKNREENEEFNFYDGPPFATGTPHYGHILAGAIKDVVPRYQTMKGKKVERKFGWDTHGLPIENIVEKKLGISGKEQIEEIGVFKFNEICRENVLTYVEEWKKSVRRMGRWVDMDDDYKTMNVSFMETVWWVYKSLYDKDLVYEGNKIVPYCPRCSTPLSNFEVNQGYKDKQDKSITVKFKLKKEETSKDKFFLAWTTTPWTLMSNLGLAVGAELDYIEVRDSKSNEIYILAKDRISDYYKNEEEYDLLKEYKGTRLEGMSYEPIYEDFYKQINEEQINFGKNIFLGKNAYTVILGHHVTTDSGTGIVHIAPAYGEDDFILGQKFDLGFVQHVDGTGKIVNTLHDNGKYVFDYNEEVILDIRDRGQLIKIATIDHSYPHCWRCNTPLIYRGIDAWYVAVEKIRDQMVANNKQIRWVPHAIKDGRMGKWLEGARDWNISRNRYWGSAIPVWKSADKKQQVCVGSIEELYNLNKEFGQIEKRGEEYFYTAYNKEIDIHKHYVDELFFVNKNNPKAKKVLGIHGFMRNSEVVNFFEKTKESLKKEGVEMINPIFEIGEKIDYKNWEALLNSLDESDISNFDTILTHSMGGRVAIEYIISNKIKLERLVMVAPSKESMTKEVNDFYLTMKENLAELQEYVKDIVILVSRDDSLERVRSAKLMADEIGIEVLEVNGFEHFNVEENKIIETLTLYGSPYTRIPEVLDCWFESGSMPYAQKHYPFENLDNFKFPADFIAEGLDQTRGWFYTLLILSTALFDEPAFKNCIVNGIVLAEDGKKMSKSLQNYPDPSFIFDTYGADAMRFYLMNSPVVEAQDFRFAESGVEEVVKKVILPLWNTYYFFTTYANIDSFEPTGKLNTNNYLDKWLVSELNNLIKEVSSGFDAFRLNDGVKPIMKFMDNLTNWYIRRSRKRFWKSENDTDKLEAYETLYYVLVELTKVIAPVMPFISEHIFKELTQSKSVHLEDFPNFKPELIDEKLNKDTDLVQKIITLGLSWRANNKIRVRQPLQSITITQELEEFYYEIIKEELNVKEVLVVDGNLIARRICKPIGRQIGPKFGTDVKFIINEAKAGNFTELENENIKVGEFELQVGEFEMEYVCDSSETTIESGFGMVIAMDPEITEELKLEGYARDIVRHIQEARKEANYEVDDRIEVSINCANEAVSKFKEYIENETLSTIQGKISNPDLSKDLDIEDLKIQINLKR